MTLFPILFLVVILIQVLTLEGSAIGIPDFFTADISKLADIQVCDLNSLVFYMDYGFFDEPND